MQVSRLISHSNNDVLFNFTLQVWSKPHRSFSVEPGFKNLWLSIQLVRLSLHFDWLFEIHVERMLPKDVPEVFGSPH